MTSIRVRPRFRHHVDGLQADVHKKLVDGFTKHSDMIHLVHLSNYLVVEFNQEHRHYWSPQLQISLDQEEEDHVLVRGMYGPHPNVWSVFFYGYASMAVLSVFLATIGFSVASVKGEFWGFYAMGACMLVGIILYLIAQFGQKIGAEQTFEIHHMYTEIMGHPEPIR